MPQPQKNQPQSNTDLDPDIVKSWLQQQGLKLQIEQQRNEYDNKKLELDGKLAEKSIEHNAEILKAQPAENRKTITRLFWIVFGILVLVFGVLTLWLFIGKEEFAYKFLQGISYFATTAIGYYAGNSRKKSKEDNSEITDANVIN
jgi:Flp pilus assembly protein TadB